MASLSSTKGHLLNLNLAPLNEHSLYSGLFLAFFALRRETNLILDWTVQVCFVFVDECTSVYLCVCLWFLSRMAGHLLCQQPKCVIHASVSCCWSEGLISPPGTNKTSKRNHRSWCLSLVGLANNSFHNSKSILLTKGLTDVESC